MSIDEHIFFSIFQIGIVGVFIYIVNKLILKSNFGKPLNGHYVTLLDVKKIVKELEDKLDLKFNLFEEKITSLSKSLNHLSSQISDIKEDLKSCKK